MSDTGNISGSGYVGMQSPDGRWTWNGTQWVPSKPDRRMSGQYFSTPVLMLLVGLTIVVAFAIIAMIYSDNANSSDGNSLEDYCNGLADPGSSFVCNH